jgi:hypothetical protein
MIGHVTCRLHESLGVEVITKPDVALWTPQVSPATVGLMPKAS